MSKVLIDFGKCSFALRARCIISRPPLSPLSFSSSLIVAIDNTVITVVCVVLRYFILPHHLPLSWWQRFLLSKISLLHLPQVVSLFTSRKNYIINTFSSTIESDCGFSWNRRNGNGWLQPRNKHKRWYWGIFCEMGGKMGRGELGLLIHRQLLLSFLGITFNNESLTKKTFQLLEATWRKQLLLFFWNFFQLFTTCNLIITCYSHSLSYISICIVDCKWYSTCQQSWSR